MKQKDVHDNGTEQAERNRHIAIDQKQNASDQFKAEYRHEIMRNKKRSHILSGYSRGRRHRDEVEESVEPEHRKN